MTKLWLTYAWVDNADEDVDFIVQQLEAGGLEVRFDRKRLIPGQRLWPQLDDAIRNPDECDAWAIFATEASLRSEPCREELSTALGRALREREAGFPLIGIFPRPIDPALIPGAILNRVYVDLRHPQWVAQVVAGARREHPALQRAEVFPAHVHVHDIGHEGYVIEVRPRAGRWVPCVGLVPAAERFLLRTEMVGPSGVLPRAGMIQSGPYEHDGLSGTQLEHAIDPLNSAFFYFSRLPTRFIYGQPGPGGRSNFALKPRLHCHRVALRAATPVGCDHLGSFP